MKDEDINVFARNFLAVVTGVIAAIAVGAILYPLVKLVIDKFFHLYLFDTPPQGAWKNDLIILVTLFVWLFVSSAVGGFVCTLISVDKEQVYALVSSLVSLAIFFVISEVHAYNMSAWQSWVLLLAIPLGNVAGSWIGSGFKKKRKKVVH